MTLTPNPTLVFAKRCNEGYPVPGEHLILDNSRSIDLQNVPLNGGYLTKTLVLRFVPLLDPCKTQHGDSPEPYLFERMHELGPLVTSYIAHYIIGAPCADISCDYAFLTSAMPE